MAEGVNGKHYHGVYRRVECQTADPPPTSPPPMSPPPPPASPPPPLHTSDHATHCQPGEGKQIYVRRARTQPLAASHMPDGRLRRAAVPRPPLHLMPGGSAPAAVVAQAVALPRQIYRSFNPLPLHDPAPPRRDDDVRHRLRPPRRRVGPVHGSVPRRLWAGQGASDVALQKSAAPRGPRRHLSLDADLP